MTWTTVWVPAQTLGLIAFAALALLGPVLAEILDRRTRRTR